LRYRKTVSPFCRRFRLGNTFQRQFDVRVALVWAFGSSARAPGHYVNRILAVFAPSKPCARSDNDRLRHPTKALAQKIDWSKP
jgi:hypothetical protein